MVGAIASGGSGQLKKEEENQTEESQRGIEQTDCLHNRSLMQLSEFYLVVKIQKPTESLVPVLLPLGSLFDDHTDLC